MDVDVDAAGLRFGWFLEAFDRESEWLVDATRVWMDTAAVSRLVGEEGLGGYNVRPEWRAEIEAHLRAAGVDWDAYDYQLGCRQLHDLDGEVGVGDVRHYPEFAPP